MLGPILLVVGSVVVCLLTVVVVIVLIAASLQPAEFRVTRSKLMSAPPSVPFAQVNDFHKWEAWSPWAKLDPQMKETYEGAAEGPGAIHTWNGDNKVGEGRAEITATRPYESIQLKLEFIRPFKACNDVEFTFQPTGNQTNVTWIMTGRNNFMGKVFCMIMNMDKLIGKDFDKGLTGIKSIVEAGA